MGCSNRSYQAVILRLVIAGEGVEDVDPAVAAEHGAGNEEQADEVHEVGAGRSRLEAHIHTNSETARFRQLSEATNESGVANRRFRVQLFRAFGNFRMSRWRRGGAHRRSGGAMA